jgi:hypothetical protein
MPVNQTSLLGLFVATVTWIAIRNKLLPNEARSEATKWPRLRHLRTIHPSH